MKTASVLRLGLTLSALALLALPTSAQNDPKQIFLKANRLIAQAKTSECVFRMQGSIGRDRKILADTSLTSAGKKQRLEFKFKTDKSADSSLPSDTWKAILGTDGQHFYVVSLVDAGTFYDVARVPTDKPSFSFIPDDGKYLKTGKYRLLPPAILDGQPVYVVEQVTSDKDGSSIVTFYIDRKTYHYREIRGISMSQGTPMQYTLTFKSEKLNVPIPDRFFEFTPPTDAKKMSGAAKMLGDSPLVAMLTGRHPAAGNTPQKQ